MVNGVKRGPIGANRAVFYGAYVVVVALTLAGLWSQYAKNRDFELTILYEGSLKAVDHFNFVIKSSVDQIAGLRIQAENYLDQHASGRDVSTVLVDTLLSPAPHMGGYALDPLPAGWDRRNSGNLSGFGDLSTLDAAHIRELNMALSLNASFKAAIDALPNLAWVYYTSKRQFHSVAPWVSATERHFDPAYLDYESYVLGEPENNPDRRIYWSKAYKDAYGQGQMITVGAPVYDADQFLGTVSIDLTLAALRSYVQGQKLPLGNSLIINEHDQVIASSDPGHHEDEEIAKLNDVLPGFLVSDVAALPSAVSTGFTEIASDAWVVRHAVEGTPWSYIAVVSDKAVAQAALNGMTGDFIVAGIVLLSLFGVERLRRASVQEYRSKETMARLSQQLSKYLSPQVYQSIFTGKQAVDVSTQRKKLTLFFSDIKNFTATTEGMEPEGMTFILNDYLTKMTEIALEHGGTVDKYIGDAVVVFFGDPETKGVKEDALAAVRMAIAMQRRLKDLRAKWADMGFQMPFHIRCGINTGYCNVGNFGSEQRVDYTVIGGQVNLTARMESICPVDGIAIAPETYALVRDEFDAVPMEPVMVKGFHDPITPYSVTGIFENWNENERYIRSESETMRVWVDLMRMDAAQRDKNKKELSKALDILDAQTEPEKPKG